MDNGNLKLFYQHILSAALGKNVNGEVCQLLFDVGLHSLSK